MADETERPPSWLQETIVTSVLLPDGWHEVIPHSFTIEPYLFLGERQPGFKFRSIARCDDWRPMSEVGTWEDDYLEQILAGPLSSIVAVRCGDVRPVDGKTLSKVWLRMVR